MTIMKIAKVAVILLVAFVAIKLVIGLALGILSMIIPFAIIIGGIWLLFSIFKSE